MNQRADGNASLPALPGRWFAGLSPQVQQALVAAGDRLYFARGEFLQRQGQQQSALNVVVDGQVKLVRHTPVGEALIYIGERGFWFGETAYLGSLPLVASVVARTPVTVFRVGQAALDRLLSQQPAMLRDLAQLAANRAATVLAAFGMGNSLHPQQRMLGQLALMTRMRLEERPDENPVELPLSQVDLAAIIGVTRQTLHPLVKALEEQGAIELRFGHVRIIDPAQIGVDGWPGPSPGGRQSV
jgi:CRP/FNR family cyclic AMP-dependent transcriptional regulator